MKSPGASLSSPTVSDRRPQLLRLLKDENSFVIAIVTRGAVMAEVGGEAHRLRTFDKVFLPAGLGPVKLTPESEAELLECFPPAS